MMDGNQSEILETAINEMNLSMETQAITRVVSDQNGFEGDQCGGLRDDDHKQVSVVISQNVLKTAINEIGSKMKTTNRSGR